MTPTPTPDPRPRDSEPRHATATRDRAPHRVHLSKMRAWWLPPARSAAPPAVKEELMNSTARTVTPATALCRLFLLAVCAGVPCAPVAALADGPPLPDHVWTIRSRAAMSGSGAHSDPAGYKVYSGIGVEAAVSRQVS